MYNDYLNSIEEAIKDDLKNFKRDPNYRVILEHVSEEQGREYFNLLKEKGFAGASLETFCLQNDMIGNPEKFQYSESITTSPTTLRYAYQAVCIYSYIKKFYNLDNIDFLIIGDGYGGLNLALQTFSLFFDIKPKTIYTIDLQNPIKLQKLYLQKLSCDRKYSKEDPEIEFIEYSGIEELDEISRDTFLIANYSLSEFSKDVFNNYMKYVKKFRHAYITWNGQPYGNSYEELLEDKENIEIKDEEPLTSPNNKLITFNSFLPSSFSSQDNYKQSQQTVSEEHLP